MDRVLLFSFQNEQIKITIEAFFNSDGSLVVEGYDIGRNVEEYWGDSDYEYSFTVAAADVEKIYSLLNIEHGNQQAVLHYLQQNYNTNHCYSSLREWLDRNQIKHEGFSWS
ncbi:MAG: hypothetical protein ACOYW3_00115 [Bacteroidota bacterium]